MNENTDEQQEVPSQQENMFLAQYNQKLDEMASVPFDKYKSQIPHYIEDVFKGANSYVETPDEYNKRDLHVISACEKITEQLRAICEGNPNEKYNNWYVSAVAKITGIVADKISTWSRNTQDSEMSAEGIRIKSEIIVRSKKVIDSLIA